MNFLKKIFGSSNEDVPKDEPVEKYVQEFTKESYNFQTISLPQLLEKKDELNNLYTNASDGYLDLEDRKKTSKIFRG